MERTTLDDIAEEAGVSKGTIYLYFANKDELLREVIRDGLSPGISVPKQPLESTPSDQLRDSIEHLWNLLCRPSTAIARQLAFAEGWRVPELPGIYASAVITPFQSAIEQSVRAGIGEGEFREVAPALTAEMITALVAHRASQEASRTGDRDALPGLVEFCLQILAPADAAFAQADGAPTLRGPSTVD